MKYQHIFSRIVGVALSLMIWGLFAFTAYAIGADLANVYQAIPASTHCAAIEDDAASSTLLATNPELSTVCRFSQTLLEKEATADPSFANIAEVDAAGNLAANPELSVARRYTPVENGIDPDNDIGLLEFFTVPNETSEQRAIEPNVDEDIGLMEFFGPQTIKDLSASDQPSTFLADNPELSVARRYTPVENGIDPDNDIGLLEFFTAPNETSEQRAIEPNVDEDIGLMEFFGR